VYVNGHRTGKRETDRYFVGLFISLGFCIPPDPVCFGMWCASQSLEWKTDGVSRWTGCRSRYRSTRIGLGAVVDPVTVDWVSVATDSGVLNNS
jgi:hypothetical protein